MAYVVLHFSLAFGEEARQRLGQSRAAGLLVGFLISLYVCAGVARAFQTDATVAPNGDGQFKSIQDAINAAPQTTSSKKPWVIRVKPGIYRENIYVQREKRFVRLVGDDPEKTYATGEMWIETPNQLHAVSRNARSPISRTT